MKTNILSYSHQLSDGLLTAGRGATARAYTAAVKRLLNFVGNTKLRFEELSTRVLKDFEQYLLSEGKHRNTISAYMRMLRSISNQAIKDLGISLPSDLFDYVFTGMDPADKRAVSPQLLSKIAVLDLSNDPSLAFARDLFLLSFYLRGIPFVDLCYLRKSDVNRGTLRYRRSKTRRLLVVEIESCAQEIIDRYLPLTTGASFLLPIILKKDVDDYDQYQSALRNHNKKLHRLSALLHLRVPLTSYVPRHSWATAAYHKGIPVSFISAAMGHASEKITHHYLASFDNNTMRDVNRQVISLIAPQSSEPSAKYSKGQRGRKGIQGYR